jgi:hypothetical protein
VIHGLFRGLNHTDVKNEVLQIVEKNGADICVVIVEKIGGEAPKMLHVVQLEGFKILPKFKSSSKSDWNGLPFVSS